MTPSEMYQYMIGLGLLMGAAFIAFLMYKCYMCIEGLFHIPNFLSSIKFW